ncbi:hypothetical protein Q1695_009713 [Nippostrongylus brasiliensis]|nr:hypothetical protein Q1695_009713 [Nippostrongylus brasiliensis]
MNKRKSEEYGLLDGEKSKKSQRNDSSSSSTSGEWLCASTRVPLSGETAPEKSAIPPCTSSWLPFAITAADSFLISSERESGEERLFSLSPSISRGTNRAFRESQLRRRSLQSSISSRVSPRCRKASTALDPENIKWPSFPNARRKSAVLRVSTSESPLKSGLFDYSFKGNRMAMVGGQRWWRSWPLASSDADAITERSRKSHITADFDAQMVLDSSPDGLSKTSTPLKRAISKETASTLSSDVVAATQEVVHESDEEDQLKSERFFVDENSRVQSCFPSTEKQYPNLQSDDDSGSSDEEEEFSHRMVAKMNLSGAAGDFANYLLTRQSERFIAKRDRSLPTVTYEVTEAISDRGMSICWLSPKALMYSPQFAREPATVTLALPVQTIPNCEDPVTPIILNPTIVSYTQRVVEESSQNNEA